MNINFENSRAENDRKRNSVSGNRSDADRVTASNNGSRIKETNNQGVFALDISGTVMDNTAYEGHGRTAEDVMQDAGQMDVATQTNYMAVMSNTMSDEDFAKLQEEGYHSGNTDIETVVTIIDEIKAALAKGGTNITGYTDDLDVDTLTQITGSAAFANEIVKQFAKHDIPVTKENVEDILRVCDRAAQIQDLSEGVMKYMIRNHMEPTLDNIYKAQYSTTADAGKQGKGYYQDDAGYYAKKAESYNWQQLAPQMEKVIGNAGLAVSEETLSDAKWLIEKGLPLTEESITALYELRNMELPENGNITQAVAAGAAAIANGKNAGSANMSDNRTDLEKAQHYIDDVNAISDEAADKVIAEGKLLNLRNLKAAQISINISAQTVTSTGVHGISIFGRRQLEEVRLQMTVQANLHLIRNGFSVDTAELEKLVEALKSAEQSRQQILFGSDQTGSTAEKAGLYQNTLAKVKGIPLMPAALVGKFALQSSTSVNVTSTGFTLEAVYGEGSVLRTAYEKAGETYEALMTAPRADLGDSIKKAFRNVDEIIRDMNMEVSDENRKAVRILGYNKMEINEDNIYAVKSAHLTIERVVNKMTPASTLQMIREGINPLSMNMEDLETYLDNQEKSPEQDIGKYSEFLYKLEKNNGITEEERDAYIGIYRLFRQLEKTDGAAIGTLINQGAEPTVKNLLSAMRSNKKHGMNVTVDDNFGGATASYSGKSISEQIDSGYETSYYQKLAADIFDNLDGSKMSAQMSSENISLEEFSAMLRNMEADSESDRAYQREQARIVRSSGTAEDTVIKELLEFDRPVTADNLMAAGLLMKERGKFAGRMNELASEAGEREQLEEAVSNLQENMTGEAPAKEAYGKLQQTFTDILEEIVYGQSTENKIDIREINSLYKQISLTGNLAKEENYEVPVNINGEVTSINLRIVHNQYESGKVTASMQTVSYGKVMAQFHITQQNNLSGHIVSDSSSGLEMLKQMGGGLKEMLEQSDINIVSLNYIYNREFNLTAAVQTTGVQKEEVLSDKDTDISTEKLYETAKIFIGYIQKGEGLKVE